MQHLWITAQKLRRKADRQEVEARRIFIEMEGLGLQQVLCPYQNAPPRESFSPAARVPTLYYLLDFERLRLIVNSLIPEVSISQECLERSSNIASSSELDKERTRELVYYTTCLYT